MGFRSTYAWGTARRAAALLSTAMRGPGLRILLYHHFPAQDLERLNEQCSLLCKRYHPLSLDEALKSLCRGEALPHNAVAITVDDGYVDYAEVGWKCFQSFGIPSTVFVCEKLINGQWLWYDRVQFTIENTEKTALSIPGGPWGPPCKYPVGADRQSLISSLLAGIKCMNSSSAEAFLLALEEAADVVPPAAPTERWSGMSWGTLRQLASSGLVTVGAHTATHPILSQVQQTDVLRDEIVGCRHRTIEKLARAVDYFAYPNGQPADLTSDVVDQVRRAGFAAAFTTSQGVNRASDNPLLFKRITFRPDLPVAMLQQALDGVR